MNYLTYLLKCAFTGILAGTMLTLFGLARKPLTDMTGLDMFLLILVLIAYFEIQKTIKRDVED